MSERETNEKRKIPVDKLAGLVHSTVKNAAVTQQADATQEGPGPKEAKEAKRREAANIERIRQLVALLTDAIDADGPTADQKIIALARNLSERKRSLLRAAAAKIKHDEDRMKVVLDQFTDRIVTFHDLLAKTLKAGNSQKALERAHTTLDAIQMSYWDRFVGRVNKTCQDKLTDTRRKIEATLEVESAKFSKQIAAIFDKSIRGLPGGTLQQRLSRERRLLAAALVLGLVLGSLFGVMGHTLWNNPGVGTRQALRGLGPFVLPLSDRIAR